MRRIGKVVLASAVILLGACGSPEPELPQALPLQESEIEYGSWTDPVEDPSTTTPRSWAGRRP